MKNGEKKTFKELWANKQTKALIKLGIWFAFFFITFLFLFIASLFTKNISPKENKEVEEKVEANIVVLLNKLKDSSYSYEYKVISDDYVCHYNGTKDSENEIGFYEKDNEILKYQVIEGNYYKMENEELTEEILNNENDVIYLNMNNIIDTIKIFEENNKVLIEENNYIYKIDDNYIINIEKDANNINRINIEVNNIKYLLEFKNIINS